MKTKIEDGKLETQKNFGVRCVASCRKILGQIEDVREQVADEFRGQLEEHKHVLDLALNEAEALAWESGYPQLIFPVLATEKASAITNWHLRQRSLRSPIAPMLIAA